MLISDKNEIINILENSKDLDIIKLIKKCDDNIQNDEEIILKMVNINGLAIE